MTDYNSIPNGWIDPESPGITSLFFYLRDNPIAMFEGAAGAPRLRAGAVAAPAAYLSYGDQNQGAVSYPSDATIAPGLITCTSFDVPTGVTLSVRRPSGDASTRGPLIVLCSGTATVNGTIDLDGMGLAGFGPTDSAGDGQGVGSGWFAVGGSGGGAVGAAGAAKGGDTFSTPGGSGGTNGQSAPLATRDLALMMPAGLLTGGAGGGASSDTGGGAVGGAGGGAVVLVANDIIFNGTINARGIDGAVPGNLEQGAGGGGGGAVLMFAKTYSVNAGTIDVSGGAGNFDAFGSPDAGNGGPGWYKQITEGAF